MGVIRGLKGINAHNEAEEAKFSGGDREAVKWFKLADKEQAKVVFLQELDEDSPNYSSKNDLGFLAVEHVNPKNWRRKAVCTADEGECYGCEQHRKDWKAGWKQKTRLYINALVVPSEGDPYVVVLSQGNGPKSVTPTLIEYATDDGTITDKFFTIKRTGSGATDTSYTLRAGKDHGLNVEDYDLIDLDKVLRNVPYVDQEAHYLQGQEETADEKPAATPASAASVDAEW